MLILPQNSSLADTLGTRLRQVRAAMTVAARSAGRNEDCITLVAVSKGQSAASVLALAQFGIEHFGESYLQEAVPKLDALAGMELTWHFIGRLQANKTRTVAERFAWVHGVDRLRIAERLSAQRPHFAPPLNVCVQVKLVADGAKGGASADEATKLVAAVAALPRMRMRGLMCMLPGGLKPATQLERFSAVRTLFEQLNRSVARLDTLSMGMSSDFEPAIAAGATQVRIGTALFGLASVPTKP